MTITQIYDLVNTATKETIGEEIVLNEDLTNLVDVGTAIFDANAVDHYVKSLVNHIGKVIFVNRPYTGGAPSVLMDGWEFGSVLEKVRAELPEATENESWMLEDKASYDPNIFYKPIVSAKFFNKRVTFEIDVSITERQVKESFSNATQLNSFISMIYNEVEKSMTIKTDELIMRTINNAISMTLHSDYNDLTQASASSGVKAVNLLYLYKNETGDNTITVETALTNKEFLRFAGLIMGKYIDRLKKPSKLFNIGQTVKFTPEDLLHFILLSDFEKATATYLESDTFHDMFVKLPNHETITYWQGSGIDYDFDEVSKIRIQDAGGNTTNFSGILGVMFDRDALGVTNLDRRVTTNYNPKGEFYNNFYKFEAGYFNDSDENVVVFFIA